MSKIRQLAPLLFLLVSACVPKAFLLEQPKLVSVYFERKIEKLEKAKSPDLDSQRLLMRTKVEYGFGIIMEQASRLIDEDYSLAMTKYEQANKNFSEARDYGISIISKKYPNFKKWLNKEASIDFNADDMNDIYWLAASIGGCISSSRGNPFELINLPNVGRLLRTGIDINPEWENGSFYSAMISFTTTRSDLNEIMLRDSVDYYFDKAVLYSDGKDAGPYLTYAESIHKPFQERKNFVDKLNYVINMENKPNNEFELTNLLAKSRAKWLLARTDEYFLE
ncbi:MAG: hypothetical protein CM15mP87_05010 [Candidatus Neomarinimicrobiota bacterium]|nr:MAG: hypothetical protein CM15mP87_05010 [Candidatus Neomarinimicrobiota bacterium]